MHKIDSTHATAQGGFTGGNPNTGIPATELTPEWCQAVQDEIINVVTGAGSTPNKKANNQLVSAILVFARGKSISKHPSNTSLVHDATIVAADSIAFKKNSVLDLTVQFDVNASAEATLNISVYYKVVSGGGNQYVTRSVVVPSGKSHVSVRFVIQETASSLTSLSAGIEVSKSGDASFPISNIYVDGAIHGEL